MFIISWFLYTNVGRDVDIIFHRLLICCFLRECLSSKKTSAESWDGTSFNVLSFNIHVQVPISVYSVCKLCMPLIYKKYAGCVPHAFLSSDLDPFVDYNTP